MNTPSFKAIFVVLAIIQYAIRITNGFRLTNASGSHHFRQSSFIHELYIPFWHVKHLTNSLIIHGYITLT